MSSFGKPNDLIAIRTIKNGQATAKSEKSQPRQATGECQGSQGKAEKRSHLVQGYRSMLGPSSL